LPLEDSNRTGASVVGAARLQRIEAEITERMHRITEDLRTRQAELERTQARQREVLLELHGQAEQTEGQLRRLLLQVRRQMGDDLDADLAQLCFLAAV